MVPLPTRQKRCVATHISHFVVSMDEPFNIVRARLKGGFGEAACVAVVTPPPVGCRGGPQELEG